MKQKKKILYASLAIVFLGFLSFVGLRHKYYYCDVVTDYLQVSYYPRMAKLYSITWGYGIEYNQPQENLLLKSYKNDSIAFSTVYNYSRDFYKILKEVYEEDFLRFVNDNMNSNSSYYASSLYYYKEIQKEIFLIKFEHTRMFDVKTFIADIQEIGKDTIKLEEYMQKNKIKYEFIPVWKPNLEEIPISLMFGEKRDRL